MSDKTKKEDISSMDEAPYEKVMDRLEQVVEALERGDLALEEQIQRFEEGVGLVRRGQALLDRAEKKVEMLLQDDSVASFESADED